MPLSSGFPPKNINNPALASNALNVKHAHVDPHVPSVTKINLLLSGTFNQYGVFVLSNLSKSALNISSSYAKSKL